MVFTLYFVIKSSQFLGRNFSVAMTVPPQAKTPKYIFKLPVKARLP